MKSYPEPFTPVSSTDAAIITAVIYTFQNIPPEALAGENPEASIWKVIPYLFVLLTALAGMNVMLVLSLGTLFAGMIGLFSGSFSGWDYVHAMGTGIGNMSDIIIISIGRPHC